MLERMINCSLFFLLGKEMDLKMKQEGDRIDMQKTFLTHKTASQIAEGQSKPDINHVAI